MHPKCSMKHHALGETDSNDRFSDDVGGYRKMPDNTSGENEP